MWLHHLELVNSEPGCTFDPEEPIQHWMHTRSLLALMQRMSRTSVQPIMEACMRSMQCNSLIAKFNLRLNEVPMCQKTAKLFGGAKHRLRPACQTGQSRWGAQGRLPLSDLAGWAKAKPTPASAMIPLGKGTTTCRLRGSCEKELFLFWGVQLP